MTNDQRSAIDPQCELSKIREGQSNGSLIPIPPDWLHLLSGLIENPLVHVKSSFISCLVALPGFTVIIDMKTEQNTVSIMEYCPMEAYKEARRTKRGMKCDPSEMARAPLLASSNRSVWSPNVV